jgi:hypothetical protein
MRTGSWDLKMKEKTVDAFTRKAVRWLETDCEEAFRDIDWKDMYRVARRLSGDKQKAESVVTRIYNLKGDKKSTKIWRFKEDLDLLIEYENNVCMFHEDLTDNNIRNSGEVGLYFAGGGKRCLTLIEGYLVKRKLLSPDSCLNYRKPQRKSKQQKSPVQPKEFKNYGLGI